jgi:hypothetical protein
MDQSQLYDGLFEVFNNEKKLMIIYLYNSLLGYLNSNCPNIDENPEMKSYAWSIITVLLSQVDHIQFPSRLKDESDDRHNSKLCKGNNYLNYCNRRALRKEPFRISNNKIPFIYGDKKLFIDVAKFHLKINSYDIECLKKEYGILNTISVLNQLCIDRDISVETIDSWIKEAESLKIT